MNEAAHQSRDANSAPLLSLEIGDQEAFAALIAEYDRAIARISAGHDSLLRKVADMGAELEHKNRLLAGQERLVALGEMAAGVAHEIRNPLGGIALYLDMLQKDLAGQKAPLELCTKIASAVSRLNHIVESILHFTRPVEPRQQHVNARALIDEIVELVQPLANTRDVKVAVSVGDSAATFQADPQLLNQLLLNLVRNAVEASPRAGKVEITADSRLVQAIKPGDPLSRRCIEIRDRGSGIPGDILPKLFTPFFTTKKGGTGLGLAHCRRIAEAHGAELRAANHPDGGAVFTLMLP